MSIIENRPMDEFEVDCVVLSQQALRQDPFYMNLLKKKDDIENQINAINYDGSQIMRVYDLFAELRQLDHQIGYWDGSEYAKTVFERRKL